MKLTILICCFFISVAGIAQGYLKLSTGTEIKMDEGVSLVVSNLNLVNDGTVTLGSVSDVLKFSGNTSSNFNGTGINNITNLRISKSGGANVTLLRSLSVSNQLGFESGYLDLGNSVLSLGVNAVLSGESETSRTFTLGSGYMELQASLNAPVSANPGNLGAIISSSQDLGVVTIRRGHTSQSNAFGNGSSVLRYYDIIPANNVSLNATLRFTYLDAELNGLNESSLTLWKSEDNVQWSHEGYTSKDASLNYVEKTGISSFSRWTLSSLGNTLPVTLVKFEGRLAGGTAEMIWKTRDETNLLSYSVEKSTDGTSFHRIAEITAHNVAGDHLYQLTDPSAGSSSKLYYRLRITDLDQSEKYSPVILLTRAGRYGFQLYPNPARENINLMIESDRSGKAVLTLRDAMGKMIRKSELDINKGSFSTGLDISSLTPGVYYLELRSDNDVQTTRFIRQ